jgi:hypothetical protein
MKWLLFFFSTLLPWIANAQSNVTQLSVVVNESTIMWTGTKVLGYHQGIIKIKEGKIYLSNKMLTGGYFILDMTSIECTDIPKSDPIPKRNLENHLKDEDFFNTAIYPTARYEIKSVKVNPADPGQWHAVGELTLKGIKKELSIVIKPVMVHEKLFTAQSAIKFNRQQWGVSYVGLKDELVHDEVKLNVTLKAR